MVDTILTTVARPIPQLRASTLQTLRELLTDSGYIAALELADSSESKEPENSSYRLQLLKRLFSKRENLSLDEANEVLSPLDLNSMAEAGLLQIYDEQVRALYQVQVYDGLLFLADFMPRQHPADLVLPIGPSGKYLASVTIRESIDEALDLGCGCGIQALLMAQHARQVTATDINPRALALTRLNASLNGFSNIEVIEGSYFEPLRGRTFDLIAANLPYVLSPENKFIYRDLSHGGDTAIRQMVEQTPTYLNEGGYSHIMLNWIHRADQTWWGPIEDWTKKRNADAWLIYSNSKTPEEYAKTWILVNEKEESQEYAQTKESWLKWYESQHIERIAFGLLTLRRRTSDNNWRCSVHVKTNASEPLGKYIQHLFQSQDHLSGINNPADLLEKKLRPWNMIIEAPSPGRFSARTTRGFLIQTEINATTAAAISHLDGKTDLTSVIQNSVDWKRAGSTTAAELISKEIYYLMNLGMIEAVR